MTEKTLSQNLRELRISLRLSQAEMGKKLGMGEKMYQLYESGKYDSIGNDSVKRKKLLDKIDELKNKKSPVPLPSNSTFDLEKEIIRLREMVDAKDKIIDAQLRALTMAEQLLNSFTRKVASGIAPHKRRN